MAPETSRPDSRVVEAFLDDVDVELDAAKRLITAPPNRLAAFHLEQAAEKLVKAVRLVRGLRVTADHNLEALIDELREDDDWRERLRVLEPLSAYATTYRYPSPTGRRKDGPTADQVQAWIATIADLTRDARSELLPPAS